MNKNNIPISVVPGFFNMDEDIEDLDSATSKNLSHMFMATLLFIPI